MTGAVGILLALVAGWAVSGRRRAAMVVVLPFLAVLAVQTWYIGSGRANSPPSTVQGVQILGYLLVQVIILALALGAADQIRARRARRPGAGTPGDSGHRTRIALVTNGVLSALVVSAFLVAGRVFDPGSRIHHQAQGAPPLIGFLGIALSAAIFAVLAFQNLRSRRVRPAGTGLTPFSDEAPSHAAG